MAAGDYTREQVLALADRHNLALALPDAGHTFHLSDEDMRLIEYALRRLVEQK